MDIPLGIVKQAVSVATLPWLLISVFWILELVDKIVIRSRWGTSG